MRKYIFMAAAAAMISTPAVAREGAGYIGADFGAMRVNDLRFDLRNTETRVASVGFRHGYDASMFAGYDFGAFRVELEGSYKRARLDEVTSGFRLPGDGRTFPTGERIGSGRVGALSGMVNALVDFGDDDGVSAFVGGGAGIARVRVRDARVFANQAAFVDDSDARFAWQLIAGARQAISPNVDVHVRYRFFNVPNLRLGATAAQGTAALAVQETTSRLRTHSLLGGVTFNFGGAGPAPIPAAAPLPPPPPPPPPQPQPQPQTQVCPDGSVIPATSFCPPPPAPPPPPPRRAGERG
ncbi:MAG: outer membrane protein [Allosphingosinicella sp.]|uniref:outer membrane protein n=1 Tax=Allosphingosinicella sp. TaxID=2823234 RepID=UPI00395A8E59